MDLSLELNKTPVHAQAVFAGRGDIGFVSDWRQTLAKAEDTNPIRCDAVDFAQLAVERYRTHSPLLPKALCIKDIGDHIKQNPKCEVASLVLLTCDWFHDSKIIGICHFRRIFSNNVTLDYLAAHPYIANPPPKYPNLVRGAGTALLYFISVVAKLYDCNSIWGEATQYSCNFYRNALKLDSVEDLIFAPRDKFIEFIARIDNRQVSGTTGVAIKDEVLSEMYTLEAKSPPFVGSKTAVLNPARRLACRFLELPRHIQNSIAESLALIQDEDKKQPIAEQFRRFFQRASRDGNLADLWREVEAQYPDGEPANNPFALPSKVKD